MSGKRYDHSGSEWTWGGHDNDVLHTPQISRQLHLFRRARPPSNVCLGYDTKPSDGEVPVLGNVEYPFTAITLRSTQIQNGSIC